MKHSLLLVSTLAALSVAEPPVGGYNSGPTFGNIGLDGINNFGESSSHSGNGGFLTGGSQFNGESLGNTAGPQIRKFVSVHIAPEEGISREVKFIRVPSNQDRHVNIIFVKPPSGSSSQQTEVILPEQPQQRNVVYVLVKKEEAGNDIKIRGPTPTSPSKPEVYFVRYKNAEGASNIGSNEGTFSSSGDFAPPGSLSQNEGYSR